MLLHSAFRARSSAMAYPGLPQPGPLVGAPEAAYATAGLIVASMLDLPKDLGRVAVVKGDLTPELVAALPVGTHAAPEDGATVIALDTVSSTRARLSGPGIREPFVATLPLGRAALRARNLACAHQPLGVDLVFIHDDGRVSGLPRTTRVEVLE
jgi:alpha-D-ribose 1-methylphosphonate 5-triphosphate synthase subunit PhnH